MSKGSSWEARRGVERQVVGVERAPARRSSVDDAAGLTVAPGRSLVSGFLDSLARHPERPALWVDGHFYCYEAIAERAAGLAAAIEAHELAPARRRVALFAYRSPTAYAGVLGALLAACAYVPLNPRFPAQRSLAMLQAADVDYVVVDRYCSEMAHPVLAEHPRPLTVLLPEHARPPAWARELTQHAFVCRDEIERSAGPLEAPAVRADDTAYLLFTSGSTGAPKGVAVSHGSATAYIDHVSGWLEPDATDRFSQNFDLCFDLSVHDLFVCWGAGACLYCTPETALIGPARFVREHGLTFWFSVPSTAGFMKKLGMLKPGSLPTLRRSLFCGEGLPYALAASWREAAPGSALYNLYGPTEATIAITSHEFSADEMARATEGGLVPIGRPFAGHGVAIVDHSQRLVAPGTIGELCLSGAQLAQGYWRAPEITAERFVALPEGGESGNRWYRTGDLASWDDDVGLRFFGRVDQQVKIRGHRVELSEIEAVVRSASGSDLVAVVEGPRAGGQGLLGVHAFVAGTARSDEEILLGCRERLPEYMVPLEIRRVDALPVNANGKIDRGRLRLVRPLAHAEMSA